MVEAHQAVGAHDPDEMHVAHGLAEVGDGLGGVGELQWRLERGDLQPRIVHDRDGLLEAGFERGEFRVILQRVTRGHQDPDAVELQALQALKGDEAVALMRRGEAATEEADAHAGFGVRYLHGVDRHQGRVCPLPRTRYLNEQSCSSHTGPRAWNLPVAMPISPPNPNSPPSANWVEALCSRMALSISVKKRSTDAGSSEMIASVWFDPYSVM